MRYFRGRHKIRILVSFGKHALIVHLEFGYVGNKTLGYKTVWNGVKDITAVRLCWGRKL